MENEKNPNRIPEPEGSEGDFSGDSSSRARNRTVMLTPEITGEVRARLAKELEAGPSGPAGSPGLFEPPTGIPRRIDPEAATAPPATMPEQQSGAEDGGYYRPATVSTQQVTTTPPVALTTSFGVPGEGVVYQRESKIVGFLISFDQNANGQVFELRAGRVIVTSSPAAGGNYLVIADESVSPMHAIMRISEDGDLQILDQLSEFGTRIRRAGSDEEEELSGEKSSLGHGDMVWFGNRRFNLCMIDFEVED